MSKKQLSSTPEEIGKAFRIAKMRPAGGPLGKPDGIEDVLRRSAERGPERQRTERKRPVGGG